MLSNKNNSNGDNHTENNIIKFPEINNKNLKRNKQLKQNNVINFSNREYKNGNNNLPPKPTIIIILAVCLLVFVFWGFTNKNAQEVFINGKSIGIIEDKKVTAEQLKNTCVAKLKKDLGTDIKVNEEITLKPVHAAKKEIVSTDYILSEIPKEYTFKVEASSIIVNGKEIAIVKNKEEAKAILNKLASKYIPKDAKLIGEPKFVENVELKPKYVAEEDILTNETALSLLDVNSTEPKKHTVKAGDTLYQIAINYDMSLAELLKLNPTLNEDSMLKIGQEINVVANVPLLSVITEEEVKYTEIIPKKTETINNNKEYKTYRKVIVKGKDGSKEVLAKLKRINGIEQGKTTISEKVISEPTVEKVEIGTLNTPPKKAIGSFIYPVSSARLTSGFGHRWGRFHKGIDLACPKGTPVKASDGGTVVYSGWNSGGYGYMVEIDHGNGFKTIYGHNSKNAVSVGQKVAQGDVIGYVGSTGDSTGNHVHFEIIKNGKNYNPLNYLK